MTRQRRRWLRVGLGYLAAMSLEVGLWATFATRSFYDDFPGFGHHWIAGDGPYNAHLASDAGVGFLAVGAVLLLAAVWLERRVMQAALVAALIHGLPHVVFHLRHASEALGSVDQALNNGGLLLGTALAAILLIVVTRTAPSGGDELPRDEAPTVLSSGASDGPRRRRERTAASTRRLSVSATRGRLESEAASSGFDPRREQ